MRNLIVDLSHSLYEKTPVSSDYIGVETILMERAKDIQSDGRRSLNSSRICVGMHCGTHMDSPFHFFDDGPTIDQISLDRFIGISVFANLKPLEKRSEIGFEQLIKFEKEVKKYKKIVIQTGWQDRWNDASYFTDFPVLSEKAAEFLVSCGVNLIGIDTPSVDNPPFPAHIELLGNNVVIVENLTNLDTINESLFQLVVVPLKIKGAEASPARALAMPKQASSFDERGKTS